LHINCNARVQAQLDGPAVEEKLARAAACQLCLWGLVLQSMAGSLPSDRGLDVKAHAPRWLALMGQADDGEVGRWLARAEQDGGVLRVPSVFDLVGTLEELESSRGVQPQVLAAGTGKRRPAVDAAVHPEVCTK
jgi:hypothetical protein